MVDSLAFITGVALFSFIVFLVNKELADDHKFLKLLLTPIIFLILLFIPMNLQENADNCSLVAVNSTSGVVGSITTTNFSYAERCEASTTNTSINFYKLSMIIFSLVASYFLIYLIWWVFTKFRGVKNE